MTGLSSSSITDQRVYAQDTQPTDERDGVMWVDTSSNPRNTLVYSASSGGWEVVGGTEAYELGGYSTKWVGADKSFGSYDRNTWVFGNKDSDENTVDLLGTYDGCITAHTGSSGWLEVDRVRVRDAEDGTWIQVATNAGERTFTMEYADAIEVRVYYDYDGTTTAGCEAEIHRAPVGRHTHQ